MNKEKTGFPIAFKTKSGKTIKKHPTEKSSDGTPRYIINDRAVATYCLNDCMKDWEPIYKKSK
jgi:hypothetical protein